MSQEGIVFDEVALRQIIKERILKGYPKRWIKTPPDGVSIRQYAANKIMWSVECITGSGCWLWGRALDTPGYGNSYFHGKCYRAHRLSLETYLGQSLPSEVLTLHLCDVKRCVNPQHLYAGTYKDNTRDCFERGRRHVMRGEDHYKAVLTEFDVIEIREKRRKGMSLLRLANQYGVAKSNINAICQGRIWKHLTHGRPVVRENYKVMEVRDD